MKFLKIAKKEFKRKAEDLLLLLFEIFCKFSEISFSISFRRNFAEI
jgi:hypothetical protein